MARSAVRTRFGLVLGFVWGRLLLDRLLWVMGGGDFPFVPGRSTSRNVLVGGKD